MRMRIICDARMDYSYEPFLKLENQHRLNISEKIHIFHQMNEVNVYIQTYRQFMLFEPVILIMSDERTWPWMESKGGYRLHREVIHISFNIHVRIRLEHKKFCLSLPYRPSGPHWRLQYIRTLRPSHCRTVLTKEVQYQHVR